MCTKRCVMSKIADTKFKTTNNENSETLKVPIVTLSSRDNASFQRVKRLFVLALLLIFVMIQLTIPTTELKETVAKNIFFQH